MRWPRNLDGLCYGGDYNPEQWPESVWAEDVELMRRAGVNLVSLGVFSWARLEPSEGVYSFDWLDRAMDRLHAGGVHVNLATPTASPPPWFTLAHPDALAMRPDGTQLVHGSRDTYCVSAPAYRQATRRIAAALAERYADHPALSMWHVHNEYGTTSYSRHAERAFRDWLRDRYTTLDALNEAWWGSFWSQHYSDWDQVLAPRATQYHHNPAQQLDFKRFTSTALLANYVEQRDILRAATPDVPITTNLVFGEWVPVDNWQWADEVDLIAIDSYPGSVDRAEARIACHADLGRSWAGGRPWLLMEQAPSTIRTPDGFVAKPPGGMARQSMIHISRGSAGAMFFQWRAGRGGSEQWHPALVPHTGSNTRAFREVVAFGNRLPAIAEAAEAAVRADVALLWSPESWWALQTTEPPAPFDYLEGVRQIHRVLRDRGVVVDFVDPEGDLSKYATVIAPCTYLLSATTAANLRAFTDRGGQLIGTYLTGLVDENCQVWLGGYLGGLTDVFGLRVEEHHPQPPGATRELRDFAPAEDWCELLSLFGASPVTTFASGAVLEGQPAVTLNRFGEGEAMYVGCKLVDEGWDHLFEALQINGLDQPDGVELVRRSGADADYLFAINHGEADRRFAARGTDLVSGVAADGTFTLRAGEFAVIRTDRG